MYKQNLVAYTPCTTYSLQPIHNTDLSSISLHTIYLIYLHYTHKHKQITCNHWSRKGECEAKRYPDI
jgi:hypothetical protein